MTVTPEAIILDRSVRRLHDPCRAFRVDKAKAQILDLNYEDCPSPEDVPCSRCCVRPRAGIAAVAFRQVLEARLSHAKGGRSRTLPSIWA